MQAYKKYYYVLRQASSNGVARLESFESDKGVGAVECFFQKKK
jgi:hypothetical protein